METYEDMYNCHQTVVLLYINPLWKCYFDKEVFKSAKIALARWLSWLEHWPIHQKVASLIPGLDTYGRQPIDVSLTLKFFSLSLFPFLSL